MLPVPFENIKTLASRVNAGDWFVPYGQEHYSQIPEALSRGALGFSFEEGTLDASAFPGAFRLPTPSLRELVLSLAEQKRRHCTGLFAGILGSFGKSAVKEMLEAAAAAWASYDSFRHFHSEPQNSSCVASQLLSMPRHSSFAIFELSAAQPADFDLPLALLSPQVLALLNVSHDTLEGAMLGCLATPSAEILIVPSANPLLLKAALQQNKKKVLSFGQDASAHFCARMSPQGNVALAGEGITLGFSVEHSPYLLENLAATAAIARTVGLPWPAIKAGLDKFFASREEGASIPALFQDLPRFEIPRAPVQPAPYYGQ